MAKTPYVETQQDRQVLEDLPRNGIAMRIGIALLYFANNVRTEACLRLQEMVTSIVRNGWQRDKPLVVHYDPGTPADESKGIPAKPEAYHVLCGNRRGLAVCAILKQTPEMFAKLFPDGLIDAVVYTGLTESQKMLLRIDHSSELDRVPLDEWSMFNAVRQLCAGGYNTEAGIAFKLGQMQLNKKTGQREPNRNWASARVRLVALPEHIQEEYRKLWTNGKSDTKFRMDDIAKLYTALNADKQQGIEVDGKRVFVDANGVDFDRGTGPQFLAAVDAIINPAIPSTETPEKSVIPHSDLAKRVTAMRSDKMRHILNLINGIRTEPTLEQVDDELRSDALILKTHAEIVEFLGQSAYMELLNKIRESKPATAEVPPAASVHTGDTTAQLAEVVAETTVNTQAGLGVPAEVSTDVSASDSPADMSAGQIAGTTVPEATHVPQIMQDVAEPANLEAVQQATETSKASKATNKRK